MSNTLNALALLTAKAVLGASLALGFVSVPTASASPTVCAEDQPCWDCATMGNLICGPGQSLPNADLTYCPADGVWSYTFHLCPPLVTGLSYGQEESHR